MSGVILVIIASAKWAIQSHFDKASIANIAQFICTMTLLGKQSTDIEFLLGYRKLVIGGDTNILSLGE